MPLSKKRANPRPTRAGRGPPKKGPRRRQPRRRRAQNTTGPPARQYAQPDLIGQVGAVGARSIFDYVFGSGAYKIRGNTLSADIDSGIPTFRSSTEGMEVCHREYLKDIISPGAAFTIEKFAINPGLPLTFPFLSQLSKNFEQYDLLGLLFEFRSTSATAVGSTNTALGTVIMATNYDVADANFTTKQQMEAYEFSVSTVPSKTAIHPVECDARQRPLKLMYIRIGASQSTLDPRFYDIGNFYIATQGQQAPSNLGELWVSYHLRLHKPKLDTPVGSSVPQFGAQLTGITTNVPYGASITNFLIDATSNLSVNRASATTLSLSLNPGRYRITYRAAAATSIVMSAPTIFVSGTDATVVAETQLPQVAGSTLPYFWAEALIDVTSSVATLGTNSLTVTGACTGSVEVVQVSSSYNL